MSRRVHSRIWLACLAVVVLVVPYGVAQEPTPVPPSSLVYGPQTHYITAQGLSNETSGDPPQACLGLSSASPSLSTSRTFSIHLVHTEPGNFYPWPATADGFRLNLHLARPDDPTSNGASGGFTLTARLVWGDEVGPEASRTFDPGQTVGSIDMTLPVPTENLTAGEQILGVRIAFAAEPTGGVIPVPNEVALYCNHQGSNLNEFRWALGVVGDTDAWGTGRPDSEDPDRDGDGIPNEEEEMFTCIINGQEVSFADHPNLRPPPHDSDGDGYTDVEECEAGSNPFDAQSIPPQPAGFPWAALILLLVALLLIGGIVFLFLNFGRVLDVAVVSNPELIVAPGAAGKFELAVTTRKKKGDPLTAQIAVEGMPEGWDARTDVDHVTLEPQGSEAAGQRVWLSVEAPDHADPESAVVAVKAVPLNKQGRKDTFKMAGRASTITSINVPPDAKVPVKRGAPIKLRSPGGEAPAAMAIPPEGLPVGDLPGIKPAQAKKLEESGVPTTEALRTADVADLAKKTKLGAADLTKWQRLSDLIRIPGLTPDYAQALVDVGVDSSKILAQSKPEDLVEKLNKLLSPPTEVAIDGP